MYSTFRLKKPIFITVSLHGRTREEAITHIRCGPYLIHGEPQPDNANTRQFVSRLDIAGLDHVELACQLVQVDLDQAVRDAFLEAKWRAEGFLEALERSERAPDEEPIDIAPFRSRPWAEERAHG